MIVGPSGRRSDHRPNRENTAGSRSAEESCAGHAPVSRLSRVASSSGSSARTSMASVEAVSTPDETVDQHGREEIAVSLYDVRAGAVGDQ